MTKPSPKRGRPTKLSERSRSEIGRRLALGEKATDLAKEFRVSKGLVSQLFSKQVPTVQKLAQDLATVESSINTLPFSEQASVRALADQLKDLGHSLLKTATLNSQTAEIMASRAHKAASILPENPTLDDLRLPGALVEVANKASSLSVSLVSKHQDAVAPPVEEITLGQLLAGSKAPQGNSPFAEDIRRARLRVLNGQSPFETIEIVTGIPRDEEQQSA